MLILGHRGAMAHHPENTLKSIRAALSDPRVAGVEFDVRLSADGVPLVFHDKTLARLTGVTSPTGGDVHFDRQSHAMLAELRVAGEPIPTLESVLAAWRSLKPTPALASLNVELKPSNNAVALVEACRPLLDDLSADRETTPVVVSSFDPRVLVAAQASGVPWRLALLYDAPEGLAALKYLKESEQIDLHPHHALLTAQLIADHGRSGRAFRCWTVDDPAEARRVEALGCAAVITNRPSEMADALGRSTVGSEG